MSFGRNSIRVLKYGSLTVLAAMLLVILGNAFDQPLQAKTKQLIDRKPPEIADGENLFHAVLGFATISSDASENENLSRIGTRIRSAWLKLHDEKDGKQRVEFPSAAGDTALKLAGDGSALCRVTAGSTQGCLAAAEADPDGIAKLLDDNAEYLKRYRSLRQYRQYVYDLPVPAITPLTPLASLTVGQKLAHLEIALQFAKGMHGDAVAGLQADLAFWRKFLAPQHAFLIEKMIAAAGYRNALRMTADILRSKELNAAEYAALQDAVAPLSNEALSLHDTLENEFDFYRSAIQDFADSLNPRENSDSGIDRLVNRITRYFFLPNATLNRGAQTIERAIRLSGEPCARIRAIGTKAWGPDESSWIDYLYNPYGNLMTSIGAEAYAQYAARLCDIDGLNRIVGLQIAIHEKAVSSDGIPGFVKSAGEQYFDPYTGAPMNWDAESGLSFAASDPRTRELLPWPI